MKIGIVRDTHDLEAFQEYGEPSLNLENTPGNADVRQFCPAEDDSVATCVWEDDSLEVVRDYTDTLLGDASTQTYAPISEEGGLGVTE